MAFKLRTDGNPDTPCKTTFLKKLIEFDDAPFAFADDGSMFRIWMQHRAERTLQGKKERGTADTPE